MKPLKCTKTHDNLKAAFAGESQANRRYLYFASKADVEGQNDVAALFRSTAEGETGHAHGHLDYLAQVGDPATDLPIGSSRQNLKAAVAGETHEYTDMYPGMAKGARGEGKAPARARREGPGRGQGRVGPVLRVPPVPQGRALERQRVGRTGCCAPTSSARSARWPTTSPVTRGCRTSARRPARLSSSCPAPR